MQIIEGQLYKEDIINLLTENRLPVDDLPIVLDDFYIALDNDDVIGVAGLEVYGNYGLLRSVAVKQETRRNGIAALLITQIEAVAAEKSLEGIYLLTETAADYFDNHGYEHVARMDVPDEIKATSQFTSGCPETATAMKKSISQ